MSQAKFKDAKHNFGSSSPQNREAKSKPTSAPAKAETHGDPTRCHRWVGAATRLPRVWAIRNEKLLHLHLAPRSPARALRSWKQPRENARGKKERERECGTGSARVCSAVARPRRSHPSCSHVQRWSARGRRLPPLCEKLTDGRKERQEKIKRKKLGS